MTTELRSLKDLSSHELADLREVTQHALNKLRSAPRRFPADSHRAIDETVAEAKAKVIELLDDSLHWLSRAEGTAVTPHPTLGSWWALAADPQLAALWHDRVTADIIEGSRSGFVPGGPDRADYEAQKAEYETTLAAIDAEVSLRGKLQQYQSLAAELEGAER